MNILILGSSGSIGQVLLKSLNQEGHNVFGISRNSGDIRKDLLKISDSEISEILETNKINIVINSSGVLKPTALDDYLLNSTILIKFFNNKIGKKLKYIVIGSAAEYGLTEDSVIEANKCSPNPQNLYGLSKLTQTAIAEYFKEHFGIDIVVFRLFNIIAPFLPERSFIGSLISAIKRGSEGVIQVNNDKIERDFIDLRDFVNLIINAINKPSINQAIFNVGNGHNVNYKEVIVKAFELLDKYNLPKPRLVSLHKEEVFSTAECNISDTKLTFNWKPEYTLSESLEWCLKDNNLIKEK